MNNINSQYHINYINNQQYHMNNLNDTKKQLSQQLQSRIDTKSPNDLRRYMFSYPVQMINCFESLRIIRLIINEQINLVINSRVS